MFVVSVVCCQVKVTATS